MRPANEHTMEWTADLGDEEADVLLRYSYAEGAAAYSTWNCPMGYPADPPEIELYAVERLDTGEVLVLSNDQEDKAIEFICDKHYELNSEPDYAEDWHNEW